jgi:surface polysaccharide O-acyltransferase-like enzyme
VLIYTISLASILFYVFKNIKTQSPIIKSLANLSFFVFFIHVFVLETIWKLFGNNLAQVTHNQIFQNVFYDPIFFILTAGISFLIAYLVHKIPYLEKLSG